MIRTCNFCNFVGIPILENHSNKTLILILGTLRYNICTQEVKIPLRASFLRN